MNIILKRETWITLWFSCFGIIVLIIGVVKNMNEFVILGFIMTAIISPLLQLILPKKMLDEKI